jgi:hypothetical protein
VVAVEARSVMADRWFHVVKILTFLGNVKDIFAKAVLARHHHHHHHHHHASRISSSTGGLSSLVVSLPHWLSFVN